MIGFYCFCQGEVKSKTYLDVQKIARDTINKIGYTKGDYMFDGNSCGVLSRSILFRPNFQIWLAPKYFEFSVVPDCKLPNDNLVHYGHRTLGNGDIYFITNQTDKKQKLQVILHFKTIVNRIKIDFQRLLSILIASNQLPSLLFFLHTMILCRPYFFALNEELTIPLKLQHRSQ